MAMHGETIATGAPTTCSCGWNVELDVQKSAAGFYVGAVCPNCGPYSRESGYYATRDEAAAALAANDFGRVYDYVPGGLEIFRAAGTALDVAVWDQLDDEIASSFWDDYDTADWENLFDDESCDSDDEIFYDILDDEMLAELEDEFFTELATVLVANGYFTDGELAVLAEIGRAPDESGGAA